MGCSFKIAHKRRFMPRKPLDVRKAHGRLSAYGKQKAPWGCLVLALCLNTVLRRGSRQAERGINSRDSLSLQINFHFEFVLCVVCPVNSVSVTLVPLHYITIHSVLLPIPKLLPLSFQRKHAFHRLTMPLCRAFRQ